MFEQGFLMYNCFSKVLKKDSPLNGFFDLQDVSF